MEKVHLSCPCENGGVCQGPNETLPCLCVGQYYGGLCDQCACEPFGKCVNTSINQNGCECTANRNPKSGCMECASGYYGSNCDPCPGGANHPCNDHGYCDVGVLGSGNCSCELGWSGYACDSRNPFPKPSQRTPDIILISAVICAAIFLLVLAATAIFYVKEHLRREAKRGKRRRRVAGKNGGLLVDEVRPLLGAQWLDQKGGTDHSTGSSQSGNSNSAPRLYRPQLYGGNHLSSGNRSSSGGQSNGKMIGLDKQGDDSWLINVKQLTIFEKVGSGGSSLVFRGSYLGFVVAVKVISLPRVATQAEFNEVLESFRMEADMHSKLHHDNIVRFFGYSLRSSELLIVEEFCNGSLDDIIDSRSHYLKNSSSGSLKSKKTEDGEEATTTNSRKKQKVPYAPVLQIPASRNIEVLKQVAQGLAFLHSKNTIHRDLKPANILFSKTMIVKICDFGVARQFNQGESLTLTGQIGTPLYMAPEILADSRIHYRLDPSKVDTYSFGLLMWAVFTRKAPYQEVMRETGFLNAFQLATKVIKGLRPRLAEVEEAGMPAHLIELMKTCWAEDPASRPSFKDIMTKL